MEQNFRVQQAERGYVVAWDIIDPATGALIATDCTKPQRQELAEELARAMNQHPHNWITRFAWEMCRDSEFVYPRQS